MDDYVRLEGQIQAIAKEQAEMELQYAQQLARLESALANMITSCPHREAIARASNNVARLAALEGRMENLRNESIGRDDRLAESIRQLERAFDKSGVVGGLTGGGVVATLAAVAIAIGKGLGWW